MAVCFLLVLDDEYMQFTIQCICVVNDCETYLLKAFEIPREIIRVALFVACLSLLKLKSVFVVLWGLLLFVYMYESYLKSEGV